MSSSPRTEAEQAFYRKSRGSASESSNGGPHIPLSDTQRLIRLLRDEPYSIRLHIELADAYIAENRFEDAVGIMKKAIELPTADESTKDRYDDVQILWARSRLALATAELGKESTEELSGLAEKLRLEVNRLEFDVYRRRMDRFPNDHELRYKLARTLRRNGHLDEAEQHLNRLLNEPAWKGEAHLELGGCREVRQQHTEALRHYRMSSGVRDARPETRKLALYRAAVLATRIKLTDSARQYLTDLVQLDPQYRDAATLLKRLPE